MSVPFIFTTRTDEWALSGIEVDADFEYLVGVIDGFFDGTAITLGDGTSLTLLGKSDPMIGSLFDGALGTFPADPVLTPGPVLKISKTLGILSNPTPGCVNQIDQECGSALEVASVAVDDDTMMNVGLNVLAWGYQDTVYDSGSADNIAIYAVGTKVSNAVGSGTGLYAEGGRYVSGTGVQALGIEVQVANFTDVDCIDPGPNNSFSNCTGISVLSKGNETAGVTGGIGIRIGGVNTNNRFQTGFGCQDTGPEGACWDDASSAVSSMRIRGGSRTYGLNALEGLFTAQAIALNDDHQIGWGDGANPVVLLGSESTATLTLAISGGGSPVLKLIGTGTNKNKSIDAASEHFRVLAHDGTTVLFDLSNAGVPLLPGTPSGAATGKKVVCIDTSTGQLHASSTGVDCTN